MADVSGTRVVAACNDSCGCPDPCPGGATCRCAALATEVNQKKCLSGNNCGCESCRCGPFATAAAGAEKEQFYCRCEPTCTCTPCA